MADSLSLSYLRATTTPPPTFNSLCGLISTSICYRYKNTEFNRIIRNYSSGWVNANSYWIYETTVLCQEPRARLVIKLWIPIHRCRTVFRYTHNSSIPKVS